MKMNDALRFPAEWERQGAVLLAWPHSDTDWSPMLDKVDSCYVRICETLSQHTTLIVATPDRHRLLPLILMSDIVPERLIWADVETNDTWTRDYGPLITTTGPDDWQINDFKFNGWGLKFAADKDNLVSSHLYDNGVLIGEYNNRLGFVLEGGAIESDGNGTLLTTERCLLSPNRNGDLSKEEIERRLKEYLGANRVLWIKNGALEGDDTDSHIDTLVRLAPDDTIVYVGCTDPKDSHYNELSKMKQELFELRSSDGLPYKLYELPLPDAIFDEEGNRLPATYANFLIINNIVFMPSYRQPIKDKEAQTVLTKAFPQHKIITIDCTELIYQHGSLHCATMQLPYEILPLCPTPCE